MSKPKFTISAEAQNGKAVIRIDGYISEWNNHAAGFKAALDKIIGDGIKDADIYINSGGGDCFQANEIGNEIERFPGTVNAHLGALCASAVTYIASKCTNVIISKNTSYMIHKPWSYFSGNSDEIKSTLKLLENLEKNYVATYAAKTGLSASKIKELWAVDYWMDADEAIEKGFADSIEGEAEITTEDIAALAIYKDAPKVAASIKPTPNHTPNNNNQNQISTEMKELLLQMSGLPATATEVQLIAYMEGLKAKAAKADDLQTQLTALKTSAHDEKCTVVLDGWVAAKKIVASQRDFYKKNLTEDFEGTKAMVDAMPGLTPLSSTVKPTPVAGAEDRSNWTYADYQKKNAKALAALATEDEPRFRELYEAHYGKKLS